MDLRMPHSERPASMQAYATREMQKETKKMFDLAEAGDVRGVRAVMESIDLSHPGYLQTTAGRYNLRTAAVCAARYGRLDVIRYSCGERRVPRMATPPDEIAWATRLGSYKVDGECHFIPLRIAAEAGDRDMCLYLLSLTGPEDDLTGSWLNGLTLMHFAVMGGNLSFLQALVQRGVEFDVRNGLMMPPVHFAVTMCRLLVLRFLLAQYRARGREQQDVLREVEGRPNAGGPSTPAVPYHVLGGR